MSKYDPLRDTLLKIPPNVSEKTMTFCEIERILGFELHGSAYNHRPWWPNPSSASDHPYAQAWLAAGWKVEAVNQSQKWVRFRRVVGIKSYTKTPYRMPEKTLDRIPAGPLAQTTSRSLKIVISKSCQNLFLQVSKVSNSKHFHVLDKKPYSSAYCLHCLNIPI